MPIFTIFTAISGSYPDITANNNKTFSKVPFFRVYINLNVRVGWIGFVVAHSRYTNTASWATALHPVILGRGGGSRLVNNPG